MAAGVDASSCGPLLALRAWIEIGALVGLLLPAVQAAREAERRSSAERKRDAALSKSCTFKYFDLSAGESYHLGRWMTGRRC